MRRLLTRLALLLFIASLSFSQVLPSSHHISQTMPIVSPQIGSPQKELAADRPGEGSQAKRQSFTQPDGSPAAQSNSWKLLATLPGVIHDIAFPTAKIGYAVGEQGEVFETTNGGNTWVQQTLGAAQSDYFYGVDAITTEKVIISGFYDSSNGDYGVFRWTEDGGSTWSSDMSPGPEWLQQVRFVKKQDGIIIPLAASGSGPTTASYTTDGGGAVADWQSAVADPSGAWFGAQFSLLNDLHARAAGVNFCTSLTGGSQWSCVPSVDSVFDGPVFFLNDKYGWVGGGEISPNVEGWMHVTTNGGKTWSGRTLDGPWPIRSVLFLTSKIGWAGGGNVYSDVGGVYFSTDGGNTWSVDVTTNSEMGSCAQHAIAGGHHQLWCAGFNYNGNFNSVIYSTQY